ncbi:metal ABC transporter solute-binding protein, Zn/Mn family [Lactobacillus psittaci]|uniref:ABC transporter solute-binding component n=1 Tax=Lactobacillus psittaci DSM 15354 TaxID=1122152 RepID=A0A0R1S237_9LACO|nr:ABC transporter solute-binding component [Lactobacillus psittaci DSM 15354]
MRFKKIMSLLLVVAVSVVAIACSKNKANDNNKIQVVTSTNVYADIAKNIVGKYGKVTAIIKNGDTDPHDFEPTTKSGLVLSHADIIIANGMGYDNWMQKLAKANGKKAVRVGEDIMKYKSNANPHIWYNLQMPTKYVNYLVRRLTKLDKKHAKYYQTNAEEYLAKIAKIKQVSSQIDGKKSKPVFVSEPVFDYALEASGFKIGNRDFEEAIENEVDPSAKIISKMNRQIKNKEIAFFVNNTQASSSTVNTLVKKAKSNGIKVISVRETMPNGVTYYNWMKQNYDNLAKVAK